MARWGVVTVSVVMNATSQNVPARLSRLTASSVLVGQVEGGQPPRADRGGDAVASRREVIEVPEFVAHATAENEEQEQGEAGQGDHEEKPFPAAPAVGSVLPSAISGT